MSIRSLSCFVLLSILLWSSALCFAQGGTAAINGRVVDPQNLAVPGATVIARNVETSIERSTKTTADGLYHLISLQPGSYDVTIRGANFAQAVAKGVHINVGDAIDLNFKLQLPGVETEVVVTGQAPLIETTKTDISSTINDADLARLPVTNAQGGGGGSGINDFASMALTAPGVRQDQSSVSFDLVGPGAYNDRDTIYNIDGGNIRDQVTAGRDGLGASVDEIKEFQVLTNNYNAEYGQAGGLIINAVTKSGTNTIHGDFHFFGRGRNLTASTLFYNLGLYADPSSCPAKNLDSSGNLKTLSGCPRAPFFKHETGFTLGGPLIKNKTFWFASYEKLLQGAPATLSPPGTFDFSTGVATPSPGNITIQQPDDEVLWSVKLDHKLTTGNLVSARFNAQRITLDNQLVQIASIASPESLVALVTHDHTLNLSLTSTVTPHLVNEARFFWHRFLNGIPTKSQSPAIQGSNFYFGAAFCCPQGGEQNRYQGTDNLSWVHGTHTFKAGINFSYFPYFSLFQQVHFGRWRHGSAFPPTGPGGANPPTALDFGAGPGAIHAKDNIYGWYVQDTWKITPSLTLNYGLRWDYEAGAFRGGYVFKNGTCFQGNGIIPACSSDKNNFQPRLGIAWAPNFKSGPFHRLFGDQDKSLITMSFAEMTQLAYLNISLDSLIFDGANLVTGAVAASAPCNAGNAVFSAWPNFPSDAALAPCFTPGSSFGRVRPISPKLHNPELRHVSMSFERELTRDAVLTLQYVGAFGFGQFGERDTNFPSINEDPAHPGFFYFGDRPDPRFTAIRTNENSRTSSYNGLIVDVAKRMSHHFQIHGGYTWSHTLASTEDFFGVSEPGDPRNISAEKADAQIDSRHSANIGAVFDTEKLMGNSFLRHFVNDWQFAVSTQLNSGKPWPISTGDVPFANALFFGINNESFQRPNVLSDGTVSTAGIADAFGGGGFGNYLISPNAVTSCLSVLPSGPCPTANTFLAPSGASALGAVDAYTGDIVDFQQLNGNLRRNAGRTDPYYRTDLSITRSFRVPVRSEGIRVELRADFFNLFNRTNFIVTNFGGAPNTAQFSLPGFAPGYQNCTGCVNPLSGQLIGLNGQALHLSDLQHGRITAKKDLLNPNFLGMGDPISTPFDFSRQIQLSVRVRF